MWENFYQQNLVTIAQLLADWDPGVFKKKDLIESVLFQEGLSNSTSPQGLDRRFPTPGFQEPLAIDWSLAVKSSSNRSKSFGKVL
jgi:hypothetical protein